jgi:hypothetical protein
VNSEIYTFTITILRAIRRSQNGKTGPMYRFEENLKTIGIKDSLVCICKCVPCCGRLKAAICP